MKKTLSIILSIVMLFSIATTANLSVYAGGWLSYAKPIEFETTYTESASRTDYFDDYYYDSFCFSVPQAGKVSVYIESENEYYLDYYSHHEYYATRYRIYPANNIDSYIYEGTYYGSIYSEARGVYYGTSSFVLEKGTYYFVMIYGWDNFDYHYTGTTYDILVQPTT